MIDDQQGWSGAINSQKTEQIRHPQPISLTTVEAQFPDRADQKGAIVMPSLERWKGAPAPDCDTPRQPGEEHNGFERTTNRSRHGIWPTPLKTNSEPNKFETILHQLLTTCLAETRANIKDTIKPIDNSPSKLSARIAKKIQCTTRKLKDYHHLSVSVQPIDNTSQQP